ncbi:hypothetical protein AMTRI_Chr07g80300 [Amborella trichopoda]
MMMQGGRKIRLEFLTPQHPSFRSNNWGGASPMLAKNVPAESLESKYYRLNSIRAYDEFIPVLDAQKESKIHGLKLISLFRLPRRRRESRELGASSKKRSSWLPPRDPTNRWPQENSL